MPKKPKVVFAEMWINPCSNMKHLSHHVWDRRETDAANARYLELADVALRDVALKKMKSVVTDQFVLPEVIDEG